MYQSHIIRPVKKDSPHGYSETVFLSNERLKTKEADQVCVLISLFALQQKWFQVVRAPVI
jgi:hypothetical protein